MKFDNRKNYYMTFDTETGSVSDPKIYDIGLGSSRQSGKYL